MTLGPLGYQHLGTPTLPELEAAVTFGADLQNLTSTTSSFAPPTLDSIDGLSEASTPTEIWSSGNELTLLRLQTAYASTQSSTETTSTSKDHNLQDPSHLAATKKPTFCGKRRSAFSPNLLDAKKKRIDFGEEDDEDDFFRM